MTHQNQTVKISDLIIKKYMPIFNSDIKHVILTSGRAGTKSSFAAIRADYQIVSDNGSVVVLRKHHNKLRKTVYKEMLRGINRLKIPKNKFNITKSPMEITYKKTGSTIYFSGSDGIDDTKGIIDEDKPIKLVILDELTEFFDDGDGEDEIQNIEATFVRGNNSGFQMLYLYNKPKNPNAPINKWCEKMEKRDDCIHIHTDYRDVPAEWIGQDLVDTAEQLKRIDERQYRWVWLGEPIGIDDLIYYMFDDRRIISPPKEQYDVIGIGGDYGQQNPTTFQAFGLNVENKQFNGLDEYFYSGRDKGKQKSPGEFAGDFVLFVKALSNKYRCTKFYLALDPSAEGLREEIKRACQKQGVSIHFRQPDNSVALGISRVQKLLTYNVLTVSPKQKNLVYEFGVYGYDKKSIEKGKEVPMKKDDHGLDATRYIVMVMWSILKKFLPRYEQEE